jgi:hypothetical protein
MKPVHLGDGVYVAIECGRARLTTGSHLEAEATNTIFLEPEVIHALEIFLQRWKEEARAQQEADIRPGACEE